MPQPKDTDWLNGYKKKKKTHMLSTSNPPQTKRHIQTKSERMENIFHANGKQKKAGVAILISDKIDFKIKIARDKKGHYIMIK